MIRADKIYTLAQSLIVNRFGTVSDAMLNRIRETLAQLVASDPADAP
jgi:mRNA-degrading endonuclease toxin of MazEF toxin-antitoxin module